MAICFGLKAAASLDCLTLGAITVFPAFSPEDADGHGSPLDTVLVKQLLTCNAALKGLTGMAVLRASSQSWDCWLATLP